MSYAFHTVARALLVAGSVTLAVIPANAQSSTLTFQGLPHTAVGGATLRLDRGGETLIAGPLNPAGGGGVAVALGEATSWTAEIGAVAYRTLPLNLAWSAYADGQRISAAAMRRTAKGYEVSASFTGATTPTYSALVYNDGRLVGGIGGLPPTAHINLNDFQFCDTLSEICRIAAEFHNAFNGACLWVFTTGSTSVGVALPNGVVVKGNELRLVEEVRPAGHYPYLTFDAIVLQSNAYELAFFSETAR